MPELCIGCVVVAAWLSQVRLLFGDLILQHNANVSVCQVRLDDIFWLMYSTVCLQALERIVQFLISWHFEVQMMTQPSVPEPVDTQLLTSLLVLGRLIHERGGINDVRAALLSLLATYRYLLAVRRIILQMAKVLVFFALLALYVPA